MMRNKVGIAISSKEEDEEEEIKVMNGASKEVRIAKSKKLMLKKFKFSEVILFLKRLFQK